MTYGPLMIDIAGTTLSDLDRHRLADPRVGGVILFSRNYRCRAQLQELCAEIHALRTPPLLIAVDHEGGRVQRFRDEFTAIPAMRGLGEYWDTDPVAAVKVAQHIGFVLAAELRALGVDFSFAPVLDLDWQRSSVVGNRSFHGTPEAVIALAGGVIVGMHKAGMKSCGKHFPGHGWAAADSHVAMPIDERSLLELEVDFSPYRALPLDAVMPAHVVYPCVDSQPAGFSSVWLTFLRQSLGFNGAIFSDDLSMEGATVAGDIVQRADAAWQAGCDVLLVCNAPDAVGDLLARWHPDNREESSKRFANLQPHGDSLTWNELTRQADYQIGSTTIASFAVRSGNSAKNAFA